MGSNNVCTIAKHVCLKSGSLSAVLASVQATVTNEIANVVLLNGAWISGGVALASSAVWLGVKVLDRRLAAVPGTSSAEEADFPVIREIAVQFFGEKVSSLERMKQWASIHPGVFNLVTTEKRDGARKVVDIDGYYCALPLTEGAAEEVAAERRGVSDVNAQEICPPGAVPAAIYVGAVVAKSESTKGVALQSLLTLVKGMAKNRRDVKILARPVTPEGLRLVRAFGLLPVRAGIEDPMGALHAGRLEQLMPNGRRSRRSAGTRRR